MTIEVRDIIERLRDHRAGRGHGTCADCYSNAMDDGADEIKRLRQWNNEAQTVMDMQQAEIDHLRAALKKLAEAGNYEEVWQMCDDAEKALHPELR